MLPNILFFWFFWPSIYIENWRNEMAKSVVIGLMVNVIFIAIYVALHYRREKESQRFWMAFIFSMVINLIYILITAIKIDSEMVTDSYRFIYAFNFMVAVSVWNFLLFYLVSFFLRAKKYFCRLHEYK
jgi:cytochrome bd-type quinol oxidase subunit 1